MKRSIRISTIETVLGSKAMASSVHDEFIAVKAPSNEDTEQESNTAAATELQLNPESEDENEKKMELPTVFHRVDDGLIAQYPYLKDAKGQAFIYDYQITGFFKEACQSMRMVPKSLSSRLTAFKTKINGIIFPQPRIILAFGPKGERLGVEPGSLKMCVRPCRVETAKGPRTFVAQSEEFPWGTYFDLDLRVLAPTFKEGSDGTIVVWDLVSEWLSYGALKGLGPWRSGGHGRFSWSPIGVLPDGEKWEVREPGEPVVTEESKQKTEKPKPAKK